MNLYRWDSEALENYSSGDIIVMAEDVTEARRLVKQLAKKKYSEPYQRHMFNLMMKDIEDEPKIVRQNVVFIGGSA